MSTIADVRVRVDAAAGVNVTVRVAAQVPRPGPLAVKLPNIPSVPDPWKGAVYVVQRLLSAGEDNPKLKKSNRAGRGFKTWGLALAPARESGFQTCASASPGCRAACLFRQGHGRLDPSIAACRIAKTVALREHKDWFESRLVWELDTLTRRADANGFRVAVRLNLTSDVMWEKEFPGLFDRFPAIQAYDYSKHAARVLRFVRGELPPNYHLTFSRSETNTDDALAVLREGGNVAVVFRRDLPDRWHGFRVVDGDQHDLRFLDPAGVVVGLRAKGTAKADTSGFVVDDGRFPLRLAGEGAR
jgi:hypothetical protein